MIYQIPVVFTVDAIDDFHQNKQVQEYLKRCFMEFAATYNIADYEVLEHLTIEK